MKRLLLVLVSLGVVLGAFAMPQGQLSGDSPLPTGRLVFGAFVASFIPDGTFSLEGQGWPALVGTWEIRESELGSELVLTLTEAPEGCGDPGRYGFTVESGHLGLSLIADECLPRRMIFDGSTWRPEGEAAPVSERRITQHTAERSGPLPEPMSAAGSWPSFRGPEATGVADGQGLPDEWDGESGENVIWKTAIPGLAHSSPIIWGDRVFVTTAISSDSAATFRPGLYGEGDASSDRSSHQWMVYALDKRTGEVIWERVAYEGEPIDKRHIKSTYASSTPATDGRIVVASFGSQGVYAYDVDGQFLWKVDVGRLDLGAYDIRPSSGDPRAHRSFGTTWCFCNATHRATRSCWRLMARLEASSGKPTATSCLRGEHPTSSPRRRAMSS